MKEINNDIKPYQQVIKIATNELTEEQVLIFINLAFDDATKAHNFFNAPELEYYRLLIEEIMSTETRQVSEMYAINLVGRMKGAFTKSSAQVSFKFIIINRLLEALKLKSHITKYLLGFYMP